MQGRSRTTFLGKHDAQGGKGKGQGRKVASADKEGQSLVPRPQERIEILRSMTWILMGIGRETAG